MITKWQFWLLIIIGAFFLIWLFWGGKSYEFTGLKRLTSRSVHLDEPIRDSSEPEDSEPEDSEADNSEEETVSPSEDPTLEVTPVEERPVEETPISPRDAVPIVPDRTDELVVPPETAQIDVTPAIPEEILQSVRNIPVRLNPRAGHASRMEAECCAIMENIYGVPFTTVRPDFLVNPETGKNLEIDCYNHDLRIGVEYNGPTHYKWPNQYPQTYEQFIAQVRRDQYKIDACDAAGVYLITVPYDVPREWLREYITYYLPENVAQRLRQNQPPVQTQEETLI